MSPALVLLTLFTLALGHCPAPGSADYDYVVVGSGAGGGPVAARLAENGYSVFVIDVGHDVVNYNTTIPLYFARATEDPQIELAYSLDEYPPGFKYQKKDVWYPRAGALGGCTVHNALINIIAGTRPDFDRLAAMFNDDSWLRRNMQAYFKKIEHALYPVLNVAEHGFSGWLSTNFNPILAVLNPKFLDLQTVNFFVSLITSGFPVLDMNTVAGDAAVGVSLPSFTSRGNNSRSSVRDRLVDVQSVSKGRLVFQLDSLATKVLICDDAGDKKAYGVEYTPGATLPVSKSFTGKQDLQTESKTVTARREVILEHSRARSCSCFPGLVTASNLTTSVLRPSSTFRAWDGTYHDEVTVIWRMKSSFSLLQCPFLFDPDEDECLQEYLSGTRNVYSFGATIFAVTSKSRPQYDEPDMLTYWVPGYAEGIVPGFAQKFVDVPNAVTAVHLKAHPSSRGTVRLTGPHPQDILDVQKNRFQAADGQRDVEDLRNAIKKSRRLMDRLPMNLHVDQEIFPGVGYESDEKIDEHIYTKIFGHHVCCTNPMGPAEDEFAVLDGDFRVRGVAGLRVVDASSWPIVPGYFPTTPFYMGAEKAADSILADARARP